MTEEDISNRIRTFSYDEIISWFFAKDVHKQQVLKSKTQTYDLLALLNEIDQTCLLPKPIRGILIFKISSIFGRNEVGTRFRSQFNSPSFSGLGNDIPQTFHELLSWSGVQSECNVTNGKDYSLTQSNISRLDNFIKDLKASFEDFCSSQCSIILSCEPSTKKRKINSSMKSIKEKTELSEASLVDSVSSKILAPFPSNLWLEVLYALHIRISNDASGGEGSLSSNRAPVSEDDILRVKKSVNDVIEEYKEKNHWYVYRSMQISPCKQDLTVLGKEQGDHSFMYSIANGSSLPVQNSSEDTLQVPYEADLTQQKLFMNVKQFGAKQEGNLDVSYCFSQELKNFTSLVADDMEYLDSDLWRTRSLIGCFQSYRHVINLVRQSDSGMSVLRGGIEDYQRNDSSDMLHEKLLKRIQRSHGV